MKKFIAIVAALVASATMSVSAHAVTPALKPPKLPTIPEIKVEVELPDSFWSNWFKEHPITFDWSKLVTK